MNACASKITGPDGPENFWERMAADYPSPFAARSLADTEKIIKLVEARGVELDQAEILDIGCGTGNYTLPLARRAKRVIGLDSAAAMLNRFEEECRTHGISNAAALRGSWHEIEPEAKGCAKGFDIVWSAMTPAIRSREDLSRMEQCAGRWCVYIGWGNLRRNPLLEEVFQAHDRVFEPPPGVAAVHRMLAAEGVAPEIDRVRTCWQWEGSEEAACRQAAGYLEAQGGVRIRPEVVVGIVARHGENGRVRHQTQVEMGVMVWSPN